MARGKVRVGIVCEDRPQEHFVRALCEKIGPVHVVIAPGHGSAEQWVRMQYPKDVKKLRGHGDERVGLSVMTDGDRFGVDHRKQSLSKALVEAGHAQRAEHERIAIMVPTWSIETWLAWLCGLEGLDELTKYKDDPRIKAAQRAKSVSPTKAAAAWFEAPRQDAAARLPSLLDGRGELLRLTTEG